MFGESADTSDVLGAVAGVPHLDAVEAEATQLFQALASRRGAGVRENSDTTSFVHEGDGLAHTKVLLLHVRGPSETEPPIEGLALVPCPPERHDSASDMRPPDGAGAGVLENVLHGHRHAKLVQTIDDPDRSRPARLTEPGQPSLENLGARYVEPEKVNLAAIVRAELDARYDSHAQSLARRGGLRNAAERVVIGKRDRLEPRARSRCHYLRGPERAVGRGRVHVKIDKTAVRLGRTAPGAGHGR